MDLRDRLQNTLGDNYSLERELGGGGMSRVFLASEKALGRQVVVKVLGPELASEISGERFAREVRVAASLQHPNIVPVLTTGMADGIPYYTMPFVRGESLRARMHEMGTLPVRQVVSILRDIARALQHAHAEGVIHRDIKPENVLLSGDAAVVTDFGIAKAISAAHTDGGDSNEGGPLTLTKAGVSVGTPSYMSPEQAAGDAIDSRADIYSWGVIAYELLASMHPFADKHTAAHMMAAHVSQTPPQLSTESRRIPEPLAELVMQCLAKSPDDRPASAAELIDRLDLVRESRDNPSVARPSIKKKRISPALIGAGILILAVAAFAVFKGMYGKSSSDGVKSVAVLPFAYDKADSTGEYFGEGLADEVMTSLAKVPGLRVASRTSSIAMGTRSDLDVREIARRLGVNSVVEGTVRRFGGKLRVTAQLTNASDGLAMWSNSYDRSAKDVFDVQASITNAIVVALKPLGNKSAVVHKGPGTSDPDAYDYYMRALYLVERRGPGIARSVDYFNKAIEKDPNFARAYAGLANALEFVPYFAGQPAYAVEPRARAAAERALQLDSSLAEPRVALAMAYWHAFKWDDADREFKEAITADSTSAVAHTQYGRFLVTSGRIRESIPELRIARRLDPLAPTSSVWLAQALLYTGDRAGANEESRRSRELDPELLTNRTVLVFDIVRQGRFREALSIIPPEPPISPFDGQVAWILERSGEKVRAAQIRKRIDEMPDSTWMVHTARVYAYLGVRDTARALTEMEKAVRSREIIASYLPLSDPAFDEIRESRRFADAINQLGLGGRGLTDPSGGRSAR